MRGKKMNAEWHAQHKLSSDASLRERMEWHLEHQKECGCRPIPPDIQREIETTTPRSL
jgi:hypothetical protein